MKDLINFINSFRKLPPETKYNFDDQVAVVTGATGQVGNSVVNELYKNGANLVLLSRNIKKLKESFKTFDQSRLLFVSGDAAVENDVNNLFKTAQQTFGKVNTLVNCLGAFSQGEVENINEKDFDKVFSTNIKSIFLTCREAVKIMKNNKKGTIINIGSRIVNNSNIGSGKTLYASSKFAVDGFSKALNSEVSKHNIRVICLNPATISTFATKDIFKYMLPLEVAKVVTFVLSMENISFDSISFKSIKQNI